MSDVVLSPRRLAIPSILRFVHDRNPFYLLSALCMFVGFRVILGALNAAPGDWKTLLELIVTLNIYELLMIALALFLIIKRGLKRDGWILLGIEALFLVDLTNLNAELFTAMPKLGGVVNGICFVLAMVKILLIVRTLGLRLTPGTTLYIAAQLAFLLGLPGMFRLMRSDAATISPLQIYSVWWMAAILVAVGGFVVKSHSENNRSPMADLPWRLYVLLPLLSLLIHIASENRVYWVHFHTANIAPVLLAIAVVITHSQPRWHRIALQWCVGLVAVSLLVSIVPPTYQLELTGKWLGHAISPLRLILIGSWLLSMWLAIRNRSLIAIQASAGCLVLAGMGSNVEEIDLQAMRLLRWLIDFIRRLIPETAAQWGLTAIIAAFALLGIGAIVSLKAPPPPSDIEPLA